MNTKYLIRIIILMVLNLCIIPMYAQDCNQGDQKPKEPIPPVTDTNNGVSTTVVSSAPKDPNEIIGTRGYDALGDTMQWVSATSSLPYTIYFENDPNFATAAAQRVEVRHKLHQKVSKSTFCVGSYGFGSHVFAIEGDVSSYQTRLDLTEDMGIYVDIVAGLDVVSNEAFWILQSIDPATGLAPISVDMGFLPVNDSTHCGEGFVSFSIKPNERQCVTGDTITAQASIVFDINDAIATNKWVNTVDAMSPVTQLTGSEVEAYELLLQFAGSDDFNGCGIKQYKLYVSDNYGAYQLHGTYLPGDEVTYMAEPNHCYRFFCLGEDNVGNVEAMKEEAEYEYGNFDLIVTVAASPEEGGTVSGGGYYAFGSQATVEAQPNAGYAFEHWSYNGIILSTDPTYTFTVEGSRELVASFVYSGDVVLTQSECLNEGWNWWSSYITMNTEEDFGMLKTALGSNASLIKSKADGFVSYMGDWFGTLLAINNKEMYMIDMNSDQTVEISGLPADLASNPITIWNGWNWIGYPLAASHSVNDVLSLMNPEDGDVLKSQTQVSIYEEDGWFGTLRNMNPGQGYMLNAQHSQTFAYNTDFRGGLEAEVEIEPHWNSKAYNYADNMCVVATVELDGEELRSDSYQVAAFCNGTSLSSARLLYNARHNRYYALLVVPGEEGMEIDFRLYRTDINYEYSQQAVETCVFAANDMAGSLDKPVILHFGVNHGVSENVAPLHLYPNPVERKGLVHLDIPTVHRDVRVEIYNVLDVLVDTRTITGNCFNVGESLSSGTYILLVFDGSEHIYFGKLIIR